MEWYQERGVATTAVLVLRDQTIGAMARSLVHCPIPEFQYKEETLGRRIMKEAMEYFGSQVSPGIAIVSYETLVHMGASYLNLILNQLQLPQIHENLDWAFEDGNERYVKSREQVAKMVKGKKHAIDTVQAIPTHVTFRDTDFRERPYRADALETVLDDEE